MASRKSFEYGLARGCFKVNSYLKIIDWIAQKTAIKFQETGTLTVIFQDNSPSPSHKIREVRASWQRCSERGLLLFFLSAYCSDINEIETHWHQLKVHGIARQIWQ